MPWIWLVPIGQQRSLTMTHKLLTTKRGLIFSTFFPKNPVTKTDQSTAKCHIGKKNSEHFWSLMSIIYFSISTICVLLDQTFLKYKLCASWILTEELYVALCPALQFLFANSDLNPIKLTHASLKHVTLSIWVKQ